MTDLLRLLRLFRPYLAWLLLGILLSFITLLANVALMALSGWFISAMAVAGAAGASMNYFTPAALIRAAAIARTAGRYAERLVTHEATFRLLAELRVWFYLRLEPLAPAGLDAYRSGDLLSRIRADIDTLDNVYLHLLVPAAVALMAMLALFALASFEAVTPLPLAMQTLGESLAAARRIFSLADSLPAVTEPVEPLAMPERFAYRFQNVSFRYRPESPEVLHGISLQLAPGRKLAVVGATGCGKSTPCQPAAAVPRTDRRKPPAERTNPDALQRRGPA